MTGRFRSAIELGGTTGIGWTIALAFAEEGADVVAELRERGATTAEVTCDVRDRESLERLRGPAAEALGSIDVPVNSAGSVARASVTEMSEAEWDRDIDGGASSMRSSVPHTFESGNAPDPRGVRTASVDSWRVAVRCHVRR